MRLGQRPTRTQSRVHSSPVCGTLLIPGGWVGGSREGVVLRALPFLQMGFAVVNVSYRLARVAPAPAAVEDCLCALRWIAGSAKEYDLDPTRIIVTGYSAGGHLALTTGMVPPGAGLDRQCPAPPELPRVAAIINWYGITDVVDLLDGANRRTYAVSWLGSLPDREAVARRRRRSPMFGRIAAGPDYSRRRRSDSAPYTHATRLHAALQAVGASSELVTMPKGGHGGFPRDQTAAAYAAVRAFLAKQHLLPAVAPTTQQ